MDAHTQNQRAAYEHTQTFILYFGILVYTNTVSEYGCTHTILARHLLMYADKMRTEWRRRIGCLKLQVIFRKRATNYRALLWKMTYKDKASYDFTAPRIDSRRQVLLNVRQIRWTSTIRCTTLLLYYFTSAQPIALGVSLLEFLSHLNRWSSGNLIL